MFIVDVVYMSRDWSYVVIEMHKWHDSMIAQCLVDTS